MDANSPKLSWMRNLIEEVNSREKEWKQFQISFPTQIYSAILTGYQDK